MRVGTGLSGSTRKRVGDSEDSLEALGILQRVYIVYTDQSGAAVHQSRRINSETHLWSRSTPHMPNHRNMVAEPASLWYIGFAGVGRSREVGGGGRIFVRNRLIWDPRRHGGRTGQQG